MVKSFSYETWWGLSASEKHFYIKEGGGSNETMDED